MVKIAAIYARVSSDRQKEDNTIASQTAALIAFARAQEYSVPDGMIFEDDGYSGANLERPGLERVRDLAAEGQLHAVLVLAPDRLSRNYAYQVLLIEELAKHGVECVFQKAPSVATPEDQLLVQFQGMIAEYERAQILERSRRGKRHRARQGEVSVLSGAPYGYRYIKKTDQMAAYYEINEAEAATVRLVYERYTVDHLSIGAITRLLNGQAVPTRKRISRWERSVVWAILRNPAYKGTACFGKTRPSPRQRITRPLRLRGGITARNSAGHERPREEWIEIPVPAIVSEATFALAEERLEQNKKFSRRRTIAPSVVQGLVSCKKCGYALSRTSTRTSKRKIYYYRCLGSEAWRHLGGSICDNRPVRQDLLDDVVWTEIIRLLEDQSLIQVELDRRLAAARSSDPTERREKSLKRDVIRLQKSMDRLLTAYQEDLITIDEFRERMPALRQRERATQAELQSFVDQEQERATYLRLAETLNGFLTRLRSSAETLDVQERQRIVRLLVKDVLVGDDTIIIRHSIPVPANPPSNDAPPSPTNGAGSPEAKSYLLRSGRHVPLSDQDVDLWCKSMLGEAKQSLADAAAEQRLGRYQIEAAIQSMHAMRLVTDQVNWVSIVRLYDTLIKFSPTMGALTGRAAALAEMQDENAGLLALDTIEGDRVLSYQPYYWAVRGELLSKLGRRDEADTAYAKAIGLSEDRAARLFLQDKRTALGR